MNPPESGPLRPASASSALESAGEHPLPQPGYGVWVTDLARRYGHLRALDGLSFHAPAGAITLILGPNGAGKTTLLHVLAGLERADAGSARLGGDDLLKKGGGLRGRIGLVAHQPLVYPSLTAEENLRFAARLRGGVARPIDELLAAVDLSRHRHRRAGAFSRGMLQRLAIARALLHDPDLLLLDEPFTGLDPDAADRLAGLLRDLADQGRTLLVSTHDLERAAALSDHVVIVYRGRAVWERQEIGRKDVETDGREPAAGTTFELGLRARYREAIRDAREAGPGLATVDRAPAPLAERQAAPAADAPPRGAPEGAAPALVFLPALSAILWKDLSVELRAREIVAPMLVFGLVATVVFQFALPRSSPGAMAAGAGGALWLALLFASTLGLSRAMAAESEGGGMTGLLLAPIDRGAIFIGKWASGYLLSLIVALSLLPASSIWLGIPAARLPGMAGVLALGLVGWVASGTLLAAMTIGTRAREVLLPVLAFPLVLPLVIPVVQLLNRVIEGGAGPETVPLLALILSFDVIFLVMGFLLFPFVVEA